jgi:hypothetical protein
MVLGLPLLFAGLGLGGERLTKSDSSAAGGDGGFRHTVSVADCSFAQDPEPYAVRLRRTMEGLSRQTELLSGQSQAGSTSCPTAPDLTDSPFDLPSRGYIDDNIFGKMRADGITHADLSTDAEFLRRVSLDLTGQIPLSRDIRVFISNNSATKRSDVINALLASPAFVDKWTMYFGDLLKNTSSDSYITRYAEGRNAFYLKIKDFVQSGMPYDVFVKNILTSVGSTWATGEGNWEIGASTPMGPIQDTYDTLAVRASTEFLGLANMDCLLCHSGAGHLDNVNLWAAGVQRNQAWGMSAFFSRYRAARSTNQATTGNLYYWTISDTQSGNYNLNTTAGNRKPRMPAEAGGATQIKPHYMFSSLPPQGSTYRETFANYLTKDRQFARATVNYLWKAMMGLGIVEPADQFDLARLDPANPPPSGWTLQPTHPQLLEALTDDFIRSGFNIRHILGLVANSSAYQLSSRYRGEWQPQYTAYFARKYIRRLTAEEVHDAITKATGIPGSYTVQGFDNPVQWAMQLPETQGTNNAGEPRSQGAVAAFLNYFLRGNRDQIQRSGEATILQSLNMMNSSFVLSRIHNGTKGSLVRQLLSDSSLSDSQVIDELYLATLGRFPSGPEQNIALQAMQGNRIAGAENIAWVLLNKIDFLYNY